MDAEERYYRLLKTVYDVKRLRYNVTKMSFITRSLVLIPVPESFHRNDDE
jgi:hypothetical protein